MTHSIMTLSIKTLSIQSAVMLSVKVKVKCRLAERRYAECRGTAKIVEHYFPFISIFCQGNFLFLVL